MRAHDLDSRKCWCRPELHRLCSECDGDSPGCWRCGEEGSLQVEPGEYVDEATPLVVVHPDPEEAGAA